MEESAIVSQCQSSSALQGEEKEPTLANNLEEEMKKGICASTKHEEDQVPLSSKRSQCVHLSTALNSPALPILSPRPSCRGISGTLSSPSMLSSSAIPLSPFQNKNYKVRFHIFHCIPNCLDLWFRLETLHQCGATPTAQLETPVLETHLALRPLPHRGRIITFEVWMRDSRYWLVLIQLHLCLLISCDRFTGAQNIYHVGQMHSRVCISMSCSSQLKYLCKTDSLTDIFWEA